MPKPDRWEKAAERETARRQKEAGPLFAAFVTPADPAHRQTRAEKMIAAFVRSIEQGHAAAEARGQLARLTLAEHLPPEELAELDRRRTHYPKTGEYTADHYCGECRKRGLPWPGREAHEALWSRVNAAVAAEHTRREAEAAAAGEQLELPSGHRFAPADEQSLLRIGMMLGVTTEEHATEEAAEAEAAAVETALTRPG